MNRFFRYSGSKFNYIKTLNQHIKTDKNIYVEPFIGSGALLFNLDKEFELYIINDLDRNIIRIYETFKHIDYEYYLQIIQEVLTEFGDIKRSKESYYKFRNWFNSVHWNKDTVVEGIYLHILANSCINSMLRFGKNGMNQSYGKCFYRLDQTPFDNIKSRLQKVQINNTDYKELLHHDAFFFFDPPYFSQGSSYSGFTETQFKEFLELSKDKEFLYTDIMNEHNSSIPHKILVREMSRTSPQSSKQKNGNMEYIFSSYKLDSNTFSEW